MNFNFELILFYAVLITGLISLGDILFWAKSRSHDKHEDRAKMPIIIEYARSFFPVLLLVFFLRSFLYEPFRIPSGSLEPTLLIGDFVLVNKFDYGVRLPVLHRKIVDVGLPAHGDIFVFRYPPKPNFDFIKRVIGLPGDHLKYVNKTLFVNGQEMKQTLKQETTLTDEEGATHAVLIKEEDFFGVKHLIYQFKDVAAEDFDDIVVPEGMYFAMGDNRDDSADSRFWGFVPEENVIGKAVLVWMSWDNIKTTVRWSRIGKLIAGNS